MKRNERKKNWIKVHGLFPCCLLFYYWKVIVSWNVSSKLNFQCKQTKVISHVLFSGESVPFSGERNAKKKKKEKEKKLYHISSFLVLFSPVSSSSSSSSSKHEKWGNLLGRYASIRQPQCLNQLHSSISPRCVALCKQSLFRSNDRHRHHFRCTARVWLVVMVTFSVVVHHLHTNHRF